MKHLFLTILGLAFSFSIFGSLTKGGMPSMHPRLLTTSDKLNEVRTMIDRQPWAADVFKKLSDRTDVYADKDPGWLESRLQMYWNSHATDVYVRGEFYDHAGGAPAPAPTVMYTGARNHATNYVRPKLAELEPYCEDPRGMHLRNGSLDDKPYEWVNLSKTGNIIQSINAEILGIARDAAFLYWITNDEKYARLAAKVFDTYMTGIYYRNVPVDLNNGHQQTLVGMTSFEVIHENALDAVVPLYDFLYDYLSLNYPGKMEIYGAALKKWADNIIDNGVPHNNWNLIQACFILNIGLVLEDNDTYADKKGREYYIGYVLDDSSIRQWSLKQLAAYGFDDATGIWAECPGYSIGVVNDYANLLLMFHQNMGMNLLDEIPVLEKAVAATPQYLFPNGLTVGFGDTHSGLLRTSHIGRMVENARAFGDTAREMRFSKMYRLFDAIAGGSGNKKSSPRVAVSTFFEDKPIEFDESVKPGNIDDYVTPTFYAPNVSWVVQRSGMHPHHSLMASLNGSYGNHMHANGISLELYGKGLVLGPDAGIGKSLYSGLDYLEYYSQFPSHNTVCVDGVSSYPVMKSNHAFKVNGCFPAPGSDVEYHPLSYSLLSFIEPESFANQQRMTSVVTVDSINGYYIDVFRSARIEGDDKTHDYFYHNLGQKMSVTGHGGEDLGLHPTEELSFAGAHLYAYSYIYDKKSALTDSDVKTTFNVEMPGGDDINMNLWMKGEGNRKVFSALSPMTEGLTRVKDMPYDIAAQPTLTFVARQYGEAWNKPFVAVYEPSSVSEPGSIMSVSYPEVKGGNEATRALEIRLKDGSKDHVIVSDSNDVDCISGKMSSRASYSFWRDGKKGNDMAFIGNGVSLSAPGIKIRADRPCDVLVRKENGVWKYTSSADFRLSVGGKQYNLPAAESFTVIGQ
ncbi:MAG: heparinase II/III-family protein [Muribaculum sp.]|nr:heparinase II/III-family protein [Muribaculum sp.]